jgi:hypothetical protein
LACLSIGLGGYVSYTIGIAFTTRHIHLGYVPLVCLGLIILGGAILLGLVVVFLHLWWIKRFVTYAMVNGEILYLRARVLRGSEDDPVKVADLELATKEWSDKTSAWLSKHDYSSYAKFINDSGLVALQSNFKGRGADSCLCRIDIRMARLLDIAANR